MKNLFVIAVIYLHQFGNAMTVNNRTEVDTAQNLNYRDINRGTALHDGGDVGSFPGRPNESPDTDNNSTAGLLIAQYDRCRNTKGFVDCFKFRIFKFVKDLFDSVTFTNLSDVLKSRAMRSRNSPILVRLPFSFPLRFGLAKRIYRAFGSSSSVEIFQFVVEELDRFLSRHGLMITVRNVEDDEPLQTDSPWLIDFEQSKDDGRGRKVKKKEYAIIFPMLVLFKFLKIKMLLVPILLGVVFLKKLLIITLTLLPYLVGLFGCCRRSPLLGQVQSAGILQEVDTRGEFASNLGYSFPYREGFSYRQKDKSRPSDIYSDY